MIIIETSPSIPDAVKLIDELSTTLETITGSSGRNSFSSDDVSTSRSAFVIAYDDNNKAVGCGAIRPIDKNIAEIKRVYARTQAKGIGTEILRYLEEKAKKLGYHMLWLETRIINKKAVSFYEKNGYHRIKNYGKYINNSKAVCFEKLLLHNEQ